MAEAGEAIEAGPTPVLDTVRGHGFIEDSDPEAVDIDWSEFFDRWLALFDRGGRFRLDTPIACRFEDTTARDYVESDLLDLDRLSIPRQPRQGS